MDQQDPVESKSPRKRNRHWLRKILVTVFLFLTIVYFSLYFGLNYFGEKVLRNYLQEKISLKSQGVYRVDFRKLDINILTGRVRIDSFELIPDTIRYNQLKLKGSVRKALYEIVFRSLIFDRFYFWQIYATHRINLRKLILQDPVLRIAGFPDTIQAKRNRWRVVYEDIYPAVSSIFNDFHIDTVRISNGRFLSSFRPHSRKATTGEYEFSAYLRDVSVNPFSYYNRERVFYSRDVELIIHHVEFALADSLYFLKADELGFSLTRSHLFGKKVSLRPNFQAKRLKAVRKGDFYQIEVPSFYIQGVDLYKALMDKKVEVGQVNLTDVKFRVFRNPQNERQSVKGRAGQGIKLNDLYSVISKNLHFIGIDTLKVKNGSLEFFAGLNQPNPELRIGRIDITLDKFRLDSTAKQDPDRIFYSREIELYVDHLNLKLRDGIHDIDAGALHLSTRNSILTVGSTLLFPEKSGNWTGRIDRGNTLYLLVPGLTFTGIDLKKVFNRRILTFDLLTIEEPDFRYTRFRPPRNPDPRFKKPVDFFQEENEDFFYTLMKKYLWSIQAKEIHVSHGNLKYTLGQDNLEIPVASSEFSLTMHDFLIDSVHGMNNQGYFYSRDFDLDLRSVVMASSDSLNQFSADSIQVITRDSIIKAYNIQFFKSPQPVFFISAPTRHSWFSVGFTLRQLSVTGLNHRKLFLEKKLKANEIIVDDPAVILKSQRIVRPAAVENESAGLGAGEFIRTFEIGRCVITKGDFSYQGQGEQKSSVFSLKDIDFTIQNAMVHIPRKGMNDGQIRFDSLSLSVFPLRAVISDSSYLLEVQSLRFHSYPARIDAEGISVKPMKADPLLSRGGEKMRLFIPQVELLGFFFDRAIFEKKWIIDKISVEKPKLSVMWPDNREQPGLQRQERPFASISLPAIIDSVAVRQLEVKQAEVSLSFNRQNQVTNYKVNDLNITVDHFRVDTTTAACPEKGLQFFSDQITASASGSSFPTADSLYLLSFEKISLSTNPARILIHSPAMIPRYDKSEFSKKRGYQSDRLEIRLDRIGLDQIDLKALFQEKLLHANHVTLDGFSFGSYRDKRIPRPDRQRRPLPQQMIRNIKASVIFDTISLTGGVAVYEEQTGDQPGMIFFDQMQAVVTGFSTVPTFTPDLILSGTGRFMGTGKAEARFRFFRDHPRDSFLFSATLGNLDLREINPMLSRLEPIMISRGRSPGTRVWYVRANDSIARGLITFEYEDLGIKLQQIRPGGWNKIEQSLLTELINLILPGGNPNQGEPVRQGVIWYERDRSKGIFNFIWKSVLSGVKSSAGINNKEQKAILKSMKRERKAKKT